MLTHSPARLRVSAFALLGAAAVVGLATLAWFTVLQPAPPATQQTSGLARVGAPAPEVLLPLNTGGTADLTGERGKVVLLNFWATWCGPCKAEMPALQQLADDLQGVPFKLYSVNLQEDAP